MKKDSKEINNKDNIKNTKNTKSNISKNNKNNGKNKNINISNINNKKNTNSKKNIELKELDKKVEKVSNETFVVDVKDKKINNKSKDKNIKNIKVICILLVLIFILNVLGFCIYNFILLPKIDLNGKRVVSITYNSNYKDKGYKASSLGKDISNNVKVNGNVNTKKIGTYEVYYTVKNNGFTRRVKRIVKVVDDVKPKLEINDDDIYVCPGSEFVPEKVNAMDEYDGDLTKNVKSIINKGKTMVTYKVSDKSGNTFSVSKKIIYKDNDAPVITLKGNDYMYVFIGETFKDPLYDVSDNCSDLKDKVEVIGQVNTNVSGDYVLTYKVRDDAGNEASATRHVIVSERGKNGTIYLTFDDGPNEGTTNVILDILKEEGVKATFFVTNKGPDYLIKREHDEGHTVALHTASHDYAIYSSVDTYFNDLYSVQDRVKRITGVESKIIRFPGGSSNTVSRRYATGIMSTLTQETVNRGFRYYDWNISSGDAGNTTSPNGVYSNVVNNLRRDRVNMILMHDIKWYTRDALRDIIRYGKNNGYVFDQITMGTEMITQRVNN